MIRFVRIAFCLAIFSLNLSAPASAFCVMGMGSCDPTEGEARPYFESRMAGIFQQPYSIVSFKKTNGVSANMMGFQIYEMQYEAAITYPNDGLRCRMPLCPELTSYNVSVDKGKKLVTIRGAITFRKTERGWQP